MQLGVSRRDRRVLAIGTATVTLLAIVGKGVPSWRAWELGALAAASENVTEVSRAREEISEARAFTDSSAVRASDLASLDSALLVGATPAEGGATLATLVSDLATHEQLRVLTLQLRTDTTKDRFARVAVQLNAVGDVAGLMALLQAIEHSRTPLAVRELSVTQSDPAGPDSRPEALQLELVVESLVEIRPGVSR